MQALAKDQGVVITYYPSGPLIEYMPDKVATPPKSAQELLEWTKAEQEHASIYARPANSGPGRTFLMGLPYLLGDSDPRDPVNGWAKTWDYLAALGEHIEYYPTGTGQVMKELGEGTRDIVVSTTGWDINPRALGIVPSRGQGTESSMASIGSPTPITRSIPKGVSDEKIGVLIDVLNYILQPKQQAIAYDAGYFYPGPAVKDVTLEMAPQESQDTIKEFGRAGICRLDCQQSAGGSAGAQATGRSLPHLGREDRRQEGLIPIRSRPGIASRDRPPHFADGD